MAKFHGMILYYAPAAGSGDGKLMAMCVKLGLRLRRVKPEEIGQTVGALAGVAGFDMNPAAESGEPLPEAVMVICGVDERGLDAVLKGMRQPGMPKVALKAMLTQTNCEWTLRALFEELCAERAGIAQHQQQE